MAAKSTISERDNIFHLSLTGWALGYFAQALSTILGNFFFFFFHFHLTFYKLEFILESIYEFLFNFFFSILILKFAITYSNGFFYI